MDEKLLDAFDVASEEVLTMAVSLDQIFTVTKDVPEIWYRRLVEWMGRRYVKVKHYMLPGEAAWYYMKSRVLTQTVSVEEDRGVRVTISQCSTEAAWESTVRWLKSLGFDPRGYGDQFKLALD